MSVEPRFCTQCGEPLEEGLDVCASCGTPVAIIVSDSLDETADALEPEEERPDLPEEPPVSQEPEEPEEEQSDSPDETPDAQESEEPEEEQSDFPDETADALEPEEERLDSPEEPLVSQEPEEEQTQVADEAASQVESDELAAEESIFAVFVDREDSVRPLFVQADAAQEWSRAEEGTIIQRGDARDPSSRNDRQSSKLAIIISALALVGFLALTIFGVMIACSKFEYGALGAEPVATQSAQTEEGASSADGGTDDAVESDATAADEDAINAGAEKAADADQKAAEGAAEASADESKAADSKGSDGASA